MIKYDVRLPLQTMGNGGPNPFFDSFPSFLLLLVIVFVVIRFKASYKCTTFFQPNSNYKYSKIVLKKLHD